MYYYILNNFEYWENFVDQIKFNYHWYGITEKLYFYGFIMKINTY